MLTRHKILSTWEGETHYARLGLGRFRGRAEIQRRVQDETGRLARVEARLRQMEREKVMSKYDVVIKKVEPLKVAALRGLLQTPPDQGRLWGELEGYLALHRVQPVGPGLSLYYDEEYKEQDWDIEVCEPIE